MTQRRLSATALEASEAGGLAGEGMVVEVIVAEAQRRAVQRWMAEMALRAVRDRGDGEEGHERT